MESREMIARSYVQTLSGNDLMLEYYIYPEADSTDRCQRYGIEIVLQQDGECDIACGTLNAPKSAAIAMADCYASRFVMPISLSDLMEDSFA